jgi:DNA-binding transcriptional ArsR family regulator
MDRIMGLEHCSLDEHARRTPGGTPSERHLRRAAEILAAASEPGRIRMLLLLARGPAYVSELARALGVRPSHASQQLAVLRDADLVRADRHGGRMSYALVDRHVEVLVEKAVALADRRRP